MLSVRNIEVIYADAILSLRGVSLEVAEGQVVALLGANGAGKTTLLRAIGGLLPPTDGELTKGEIWFDGRRTDRWDAPALVRAGIGQVLEGRRIFLQLSVEDNLRVGAFSTADRRVYRQDLTRVFELFPMLAARRRTSAGYLSGGEQQMLAIGRALMSRPKLLLLDEPSLGLAPKLVQQVRDIIVDINAQGTAVLLVEQNAQLALSVASHGYVLETGRVVLDKPANQMFDDSEIREFYLGLGEAGRRSYANVKHYRRRKRWLS